MSWMDSWSRPSKQSATPPPLYLTSENVKYCLACGRVIGARRSHKQNEIVKYCSASCRKQRLGPIDRKIDNTILALMRGDQNSGIEGIDAKSRFRKGDHRITVTCDEIEAIVFGRTTKRPNAEQIMKVDSSDQQIHQNDTEYDGPSHSDEDAVELQGKPPNPTGPGSQEKREEGQRRAEEREMVRRAARRAVVFGFPVEEAGLLQDVVKSKYPPNDNSPNEPKRRKCEAIMNGNVVEPSFAKGDWAIRWRE